MSDTPTLTIVSLKKQLKFMTDNKFNADMMVKDGYWYKIHEDGDESYIDLNEPICEYNPKYIHLEADEPENMDIGYE